MHRMKSLRNFQDSQLLRFLKHGGKAMCAVTGGYRHTEIAGGFCRITFKAQPQMIARLQTLL